MQQPLSSSTDSRTCAAGFTLLELLVTVAVAGMLVAIAVPAMNNFIQNDRDATQINSLVASFNYARSEAVKRNTSVGVQVCPSSNGSACNAAAVWSQGWLVFYMDPTDIAPLLQSVPALAGSNVLSASGGGATGITFKSTGGVSAASTTKIKICDTRGGAFARDVEVSVVGNITASQNPGFDANGVALACP